MSLLNFNAVDLGTYSRNLNAIPLKYICNPSRFAINKDQCLVSYMVIAISNLSCFITSLKVVTIRPFNTKGFTADIKAVQMSGP